MKKIKIIFALCLSVCLLISMVACSGGQSTDSGSDTTKITVAYQGGIGYAPIHIMEKLNLIEECYGKDIDVEFTKLDSGSAINEGIIGGTIQVGCMGLAPAISAVAAGVPCKIISNLCSQSHGLMTNDSSIKSLSDIKSDDKIALVNTGSIQHILLAMAAENELGDAHALDNNIQAMAHAEGMAALESGTVKLHLTSAPFIQQERESGKYTELDSIEKVWPSGNSFLVTTVATSLQESNPELFNAISSALTKAINYIDENEEETVKIESEYLSLDEETVKEYLEDEDCQFFQELKGAEKMITFMKDAEFITNDVSIDDIKYDNVVSKK